MLKPKPVQLFELLLSFCTAETVRDALHNWLDDGNTDALIETLRSLGLDEDKAIALAALLSSTASRWVIQAALKFMEDPEARQAVGKKAKHFGRLAWNALLSFGDPAMRTPTGLLYYVPKLVTEPKE